jgi:16S rRNA (cytidine1402-2'-O)-methyltransferase
VRRRRAGGSSQEPAGTRTRPGSGKGPGILYLVATPIGNLEDITLRALRVLREVDWIAAEDTRRTRILLAEHGISQPVHSYHAHNEHRRLPQFLRRLREGESGALVTDAGTPAISDPGFLLARAARAEGIACEIIPGPSAVLTALLASGIPCDRFCFLGYPPAKGAARRRFLAAALAEQRTVVVFESPHRVIRFLEEIAALDPERQIAVCRELTKRFEEVSRGSASDVFALLRERAPRGEYTIVLAAAPERKNA